MTRVQIDGMTVDVPVGSSVLDAARAAGIDIPALCHHPDFPPNTSCMCCLVKVNGEERPVPSCAIKVHEGMQVESETDELRDLRRTGLELLLGDHAGDCKAPCENTCPARMDIPNMLRHVVEGNFRSALEVVKQDIAMPAILGRVCPEVCENACRRGQHDSPAAICQIKQVVADRDLQSPTRYKPPLDPPTDCRVAIVGGGPTGLTAAYHLALKGHICTIFDRQSQLGGRLHHEFPPEVLPRDILAAEIDSLISLGIEVRPTTPIENGENLGALAEEFDAVLIATGRSGYQWLDAAGVQVTRNGVSVDSESRRTSRQRVFAAGNVVRNYKLVVQSVAEGKLAAECIDSYLTGKPLPNRRKAFESRLARLTTGELCDFCEGAPIAPRVESSALLRVANDEALRQEADRCLHCDCEALEHCLLHHYAELYDCDARRFAGPGQHYRGHLEGQGVRLEVGKCIACGICVQIASATPDAAGLTLWGRSTAIRVAPPPGVSLDAALGSSVYRCAEACPTGAITVDAC